MVRKTFGMHALGSMRYAGMMATRQYCFDSGHDDPADGVVAL